MQACKEAGGLQFKGKTVHVKRVRSEPDAVCWEMFSIDFDRIPHRCIVGGLTVLFAVVVWALIFYLPYAYYMSSFSAAHDEAPGTLSGMVFVLLVVGGNQVMYVLCSTIAYKVGFRLVGDSEALYISLYTFACFMNVVVDLAMECWLGYQAMVAASVHTADGRYLSELTDYLEIFESYPMQKSIGNRLESYSFPSTFLIPFLLEPIFAIILPFHIMVLLVRSHKEVRGREAEKSLNFFAPMDLSRYGDIALNVTLASQIFFFPTGLMLKVFLALIISHIYIYLYDRYRVLRAVPGFWFGNNIADRCAQAILAVPCGFMAACIVFKASCLDMSPFCLHGCHLVVACVSAFVAHVALHWLLIFWVVPVICHRSGGGHGGSTQKYCDVASATPCTWFSANPVHCLRSRYIYRHSPPCMKYVRGREYLMRANPEIGCYFEDTVDGQAEDYTLCSIS